MISCRIDIPGPSIDYNSTYWGQHNYKKCITMNSSQVGTITSIFSIGGFLSATYGGKLANSIGHRNSCLVNTIWFILGSLIMTFSNSITGISIGRFIVGLGAGCSVVVSPLYLNEISPSNLRGIIGSMNQVSINIGILLGQVLGYFFSNVEQWRFILLSGCFIAVMNLVLLLFSFETPKWLVLHGKKEKALSILQKLRGTLNVEEELSQWTKANTDEEEALLTVTNSAINSSHRGTVGFYEFCTNPTYRQPFIAVVGIMSGQQFCGINSIIFYGVAVLSTIIPNYAVIINILVSAVNTVITASASPLIDNLGRKPLLLISIGIMGISSALMAIGILSNTALLSATAMILYVSAYAIGLGPIPFLLASELSQPEASGSCQSVGTTGNWIATFIVGYFFPILNTLIGGYTYFLFTIICFGYCIFTWKYIPETKGKKSFEDVWSIRID